MTGGTGFIGSALIEYLSTADHHIILLTRGKSKLMRKGSLTLEYVHWDPMKKGDWVEYVDGCDAVINLIGKNVFEQRWNRTVKEEILKSRVVPTSLIASAIGESSVRPAVLVSASAVGYYGNRKNEMINEKSSSGDDFLAYVVREWESAAYAAEQFGTRVATPRIGLVLDRSGGLIRTMELPFRFFVGGPVGRGNQFLPWVHMNDVVRGILFPIERIGFSGAYNLVSPEPVTMNEFVSKFGAVMKRPSWLPVPEFALTLLYGEGAKVIVSGQRAVPEKLTSAGYSFSYNNLQQALQNIMN